MTYPHTADDIKTFPTRSGQAIIASKTIRNEIGRVAFVKGRLYFSGYAYMLEDDEQSPDDKFFVEGEDGVNRVMRRGDFLVADFSAMLPPGELHHVGELGADHG